MNLKTKAAQGVFWAFVQRWGRQIVNLLLLTVLSRLVDPASFGLIALAAAFVEFTKTFVDQGFSPAIVQFREITEEHLNTAFWVNLAYSTVLCALGVAFSDQIAMLFDAPALSPVLKVMSLQIVASGLVATQIAKLSRNMELRTLTIRLLSSVVLGGVVALVMAYWGFGVWALVGRALAGSVSDIVVLWSTADWRPRLIFSWERFKELYSFGIHMVGTHVVDDVRENVDYVLVGYFLNVELLGYYSIGYRLIAAVNKLLFGVTRSISLPLLSRLQSEPDRVARAYLRLSRLSAVVVLPVYVGIFLLAEPITLTILGAHWSPSAAVLRWLALLGIAVALFPLNHPGLVAMGRPALNFFFSALDTALSIIGMLIGIRFGIVGLAIGRSIASSASVPFPFVALTRLVGVRIRDYLDGLKPAILCALMFSLGASSARWIVGDVHDTIALMAALVGGGGASLAYLYFFERRILDELVELGRLSLPFERSSPLVSDDAP